MTDDLKWVPLLSLSLAVLIALVALVLGYARFALGAVLGGAGGLIYFLLLARRVREYPARGLGTGLRLLWAAVVFFGALKLGVPVFIGSLVGFFLYKPAIILLVAFDFLRHTNP